MLTYGMAIGESGWDSINNVINAPPASILPSGFFPSPQYTTIKSETTKAAGGTGQTFRLTAPENPSMIESNYWSSLGWIGSPYEDDKAIPVKIAESKGLAASIEKRDPIGESLDWALGVSKQVGTLYQQIKGQFQPREVIVETPRAGYPEGQDIMHTNDLSQRCADVVTVGKQLYAQVKGLFGLGYPATEKQPVPGVKHEIAGIAGLSLGSIAIIALLIILFMRKK